MDELARPHQFRHVAHRLLQEVLDRLHVVVRDPLDLLDARGLCDAEAVDQRAQPLPRSLGEGREFG